MSTEAWVQTILGIVTILVTIYFSYRGLEANKKQNNHEKSKSNVQRELTKNTINTFVIEEIKRNFARLKGKGSLGDYLKLDKRTYDYYTNQQYELDEYEKVKYELIMYDGKVAQEINDIYNVFRMLKEKPNIRKLTELEYKELKRVYNICLQKYDTTKTD